ncbi:hypothetical protein LXM25_03260 [Dyadobacter sp. LJ53]|uniref:hypothetical protein n=1 Tax=Dyadobacter chenwenxiniae TaxID=2906456 RepID=UPI001F322CA2|nr:hypothetical protein [Dyadobacter chenwenxiniae]MCF0049061.1 hypothetical protein [Dyadobacter chenwenxiniae]
MNLFLLNILYQMLADLEYSDVNYIIYARYYFFDQQMHFYEPIHFNRESVLEIELKEDALGLRMPLDSPRKDIPYSVIIPFDSIKQIEKIQLERIEDRHVVLWMSNWQRSLGQKQHT